SSRGVQLNGIEQQAAAGDKHFAIGQQRRRRLHARLVHPGKQSSRGERIGGGIIEIHGIICWLSALCNEHLAVLQQRSRETTAARLIHRGGRRRRSETVGRRIVEVHAGEKHTAKRTATFRTRSRATRYEHHAIGQQRRGSVRARTVHRGSRSGRREAVGHRIVQVYGVRDNGSKAKGSLEPASYECLSIGQ